MATITASASRIGENTVVVEWAGLTQTGADDGSWFQMTPGADRSVHITGTLGVGGTLVIEGSNAPTPTSGVTLTDPQGNNLSFTAVDRIEQVAEYTRWIRPRVTGGDGTTSFTVRMLAGG